MRGRYPSPEERAKRGDFTTDGRVLILALMALGLSPDRRPRSESASFVS
jgi:hypothetical protein